LATIAAHDLALVKLFEGHTEAKLLLLNSHLVLFRLPVWGHVGGRAASCASHAHPASRCSEMALNV
jgi:hypothetical protein